MSLLHSSLSLPPSLPPSLPILPASPLDWLTSILRLGTCSFPVPLSTSLEPEQYHTISSVIGCLCYTQLMMANKPETAVQCCTFMSWQRVVGSNPTQRESLTTLGVYVPALVTQLVEHLPRIQVLLAQISLEASYQKTTDCISAVQYNLLWAGLYTQLSSCGSELMRFISSQQCTCTFSSSAL